MSVLMARVTAAEENDVPVLVVRVEELRKLYDTIDKLGEIARMAYEGEEIPRD